MTAQHDPALTLWTFIDAEGQSHVALPLLQVEREGARFSLAVTSGSGLVALRHIDDTLEPVTDPSLVERLAADLRSLEAERTRPVLVFDAPGRAGPATRYVARGLVAHLGQGYLVADDAAGEGRVFFAPTTPGAPPTPVDDDALAQAVLRIAARGPAGAPPPPTTASAPARVQIRLPDGSAHTLECVRRVELAEGNYQVAVDPAERTRVYALREEAGGGLAPVDDPDLIARVRSALLTGA